MRDFQEMKENAKSSEWKKSNHTLILRKTNLLLGI